MTNSLPELTPQQLAISHILAEYFKGHAAWHSTHGAVKCNHKCPYCETLHDMETYIQSRINQATLAGQRG